MWTIYTHTHTYVYVYVLGLSHRTHQRTRHLKFVLARSILSPVSLQVYVNKCVWLPYVLVTVMA
jgi:hypothetical protein